MEKRFISDYLLCEERFIDPKLNSGLWWCKDQDDMLTVEINAVCKPPELTWETVMRGADLIAQFPFIFVAMPPGQEQTEMATELATRFKKPTYTPKDEAWRDCRSIRELRDKGGLDAVQKLLYGCIEVPMPGLLDISQVQDEEPLSNNRTFSGIPTLDRATGGFLGGEVTVWTGKRGEGKSTFLSQLIPEAVAIGNKVCVYSGEMPAMRFKYILYLQIAGKRNIYTKIDSYTGKEIYLVKKEAIQEINKWIEKKVFITDIKQANAHDEDNIIDLFTYAYMTRRCRVFIVDNIMTLSLKGEAQMGQWRAQSLFLTRLEAFAKRYNVHVHLVAHPRKTKNDTFDGDDIGGSGDIPNKADNAFKVGRVPDEKVAEAGYSAGIQVIKNRNWGEKPIIKLDFDPVTRRFYPAGGTPERKFDWEVKG